MKTTTEKVTVTCEGRQHSAVIDTGSDWTCTSPSKLISDFKEVPENLLEPTKEMVRTKNASGSYMQPIGYFVTQLEFGDNRIPQEIVVFKDIDDTYLSKSALVNLGIITINKVPPTKAKPKIHSITSQGSPSNRKSQSDSDRSTHHRESPPTKSTPAPRNINSSARLSINSPFPIKGTPKPLKDITKQDLIDEFGDVFSPRQIPMGGQEFRIVLKPDARPTKVYTARPVPLALETKLKEELDRLEKDGIIEKVTHPTEWCHGLVTVLKDSGEVRPCVDFRPLNKYALREAFDQPPVLEIVRHIKYHEAKYFSCLDATGSYNQCSLNEESRDYTTFITKFGRYRYKRAPYGIASISDHFNRRMTEQLEGLDNIARVVDDTLFYGKTE